MMLFLKCHACFVSPYKMNKIDFPLLLSNSLFPKTLLKLLVSFKRITHFFLDQKYSMKMKMLTMKTMKIAHV